MPSLHPGTLANEDADDDDDDDDEDNDTDWEIFVSLSFCVFYKSS